MSQSLILIDALSSACLEKKKKKEAARGFLPRAGGWHILLAVPGGIFVAVRCN
jgi:hypothetical protein